MCLRQPILGEKPAQGRATFGASFHFAWQGIAHVIRTQRNARIHLGVGLLVLLAALGLGLSPTELAIVVVCIMTVFAAEMMNTVVEALVDLVSPSFHPLAKIAKDVAAGSVLVSAGGSILVGVLVLGPHVWHALLR
jgi:diacylglycerol kinase